MAVKVQGISSCILLSRVKQTTEESTSNQAQSGDINIRVQHISHEFNVGVNKFMALPGI
jgi:hypothetical protein